MLIIAALMAHIVAFSAFYKNPKTMRTAHAPSDNDQSGDAVDNCREGTNDDFGESYALSETDEANGNGDPNKLNSCTAFMRDVFDFSLVKEYQFVLLCIAATLGRYTGGTFTTHLPSKAVSHGMTRVNYLGHHDPLNSR
jgi:hypothetical protein